MSSSSSSLSIEELEPGTTNRPQDSIPKLDISGSKPTYSSLGPQDHHLAVDADIKNLNHNGNGNNHPSSSSHSSPTDDTGSQGFGAPSPTDYWIQEQTEQITLNSARGRPTHSLPEQHAAFLKASEPLSGSAPNSARGLGPGLGSARSGGGSGPNSLNNTGNLSISSNQGSNDKNRPDSGSVSGRPGSGTGSGSGKNSLNGSGTLSLSTLGQNPTNPMSHNAVVSSAITAEYMKHYCNNDDLDAVMDLEIEVDGEEERFDRIGDMLPNLESLKLNGSLVESIRGLGCKFQNVRYLWLNRAGLTDLDGIESLPMLEELYV